MSFEQESDRLRIAELERTLDEVLDSQLSSEGGNDLSLINGTLGNRNAASGDAGGVRSNQPIIHNITDVDEGGTPTGVFDKIDIISSMAIIDHTSTPITLRFIQGQVKDGTRIKITPKISKSIEIESGGNILTSETITIDDAAYIELVKHSEAETGVTGGAYKVITSVGAGGGSISEPIELGFNEVTTETPPTKTIVSGDMFNPSHIVLDQDIDLQLDISATLSKYKSIFIIFDTSGSGFTVTWPGSVVNPPTISDSIAQRISVILYTIDNGTLWTHATSVGSSTGAEFFGPWTDNHDAGLQDLVNLDNIDFNGASSTIQGLFNLDFFEVGQSINSLSGELSFQAGLADIFRYIAGGVEIAQIDDATGITILGSHVINMNTNNINQLGAAEFDILSSFSPTVQTTIGFDFTNKFLIYNVGVITDAHVFKAAGEQLVTITRSGSNEGTVSAKNFIAENIADQAGSVIQTNGQLFISDSAQDPTSNGEFRRNVADVKVFTGGSVLNLSTILTASIVDGDSNVTVNDAAPEITFTINAAQVGEFSDVAFLPSVPIDMTASITNPNIIGLGKLRFTENDDALFGTETIITARATAGSLLFNVGLVTDTFDLSFAGTTEWIFSNTQLSGNNITLDNALSFNDGLADPAIDGQMVRNGNIMGLQIPEFAIRRVATLAADAPELSLVRDDDTPVANDTVGEISFKVDDAGIETTYAAITSTIIDVTDNAAMTFLLRANNGLISALALQGDDNNQRFQMLCSGTSQFRIQPIFDRMGYFVTPQVTDFSLNLGTNGSLQIPQFSDGNPSLTDLNQAGGAFDGAIVHDTFDGDLYIRASSTRWDRYARTGTVV